LNHLILGRRTRLDLPHVTAFTPGIQSRMWSLDFMVFESKSAAPPDSSMRDCYEAAMGDAKEFAAVARPSRKMPARNLTCRSYMPWL
jgi:hypothetical protein